MLTVNNLFSYSICCKGKPEKIYKFFNRYPKIQVLLVQNFMQKKEFVQIVASNFSIRKVVNMKNMKYHHFFIFDLKFVFVYCELNFLIVRIFTYMELSGITYGANILLQNAFPVYVTGKNEKLSISIRFSFSF